MIENILFYGGLGLAMAGIGSMWVLSSRPHWITNHLAHWLRLKR